MPVRADESKAAPRAGLVRGPPASTASGRKNSAADASRAVSPSAPRPSGSQRKSSAIGSGPALQRQQIARLAHDAREPRVPAGRVPDSEPGEPERGEPERRQPPDRGEPPHRVVPYAERRASPPEQPGAGPAERRLLDVEPFEHVEAADDDEQRDRDLAARGGGA